MIKFPRGAQDLRDISEVIQVYTNTNYWEVLSAFCFLYIFLQTFAIPGPIFLSILSGALFGGVEGFFLVCFCATSGASMCYGLSSVLGKPLVI